MLVYNRPLKAKFVGVIRANMADSHRKRFSALGFSYTTNISYNVTYCLMTIESFCLRKTKPKRFFERILMTHSFLERIGQPEGDLANHREESVPFNVHDATSILEFSSSQVFLMLFHDSLNTTETERNTLVIEDFS
uniref:Uncharacterized protein n=1 Tax=Brassica oleracea var. oleracea TaxID=109376 RepID=A0A0D3ADC5_BRAOL